VTQRSNTRRRATCNEQRATCSLPLRECARRVRSSFCITTPSVIFLHLHNSSIIHLHSGRCLQTLRRLPQPPPRAAALHSQKTRPHPMERTTTQQTAKAGTASYVLGTSEQLPRVWRPLVMQINHTQMMIVLQWTRLLQMKARNAAR
jgi:hypothetical protein